MHAVTTVNVNGIRAAAAEGLRAWPAGTAADVVCLQETGARPEEIPGGAARAVSAVVERAAAHGERWSDRAPVTVVHGS